MKENRDLRFGMAEMAQKARKASHPLARLSTDLKNKALREMADNLERQRAWLVKENQKDLEDIPKKVQKEITFHFVDRMTDVLKLALEK